MRSKSLRMRVAPGLGATIWALFAFLGYYAGRGVFQHVFAQTQYGADRGSQSVKNIATLGLSCHYVDPACSQVTVTFDSKPLRWSHLMQLSMCKKKAPYLKPL